VRTRLAAAVTASIALTALLFGGAGPAQAAATPEVTIEPQSIAIGETALVSATGLGDLETATFGMDASGGAAFVGETVGADATVAEVAAADGAAMIEFTATEAGIVTVTVGTGETVLASSTVSVAGPTAEPAPGTTNTAPSPSASETDTAANDSQVAEPAAEVDGGRGFLVLFAVLAAAVVVIGGIFVLRRGRRKPRGD